MYIYIYICRERERECIDIGTNCKESYKAYVRGAHAFGYSFVKAYYY